MATTTIVIYETRIERPKQSRACGRRYVTLESGRGIAALLVVLYHAAWLSKLPSEIFTFGHAGVEFFFVLSGFVIYSAHARDIGAPKRLATYCARRITRIYPLYWAVLALLIMATRLVPTITSAQKHHLPLVLKSVLLLPTRDIPLLGVAWTLQCEVFFYALFGLLILDSRFWRVFPIWAAAILFVGAPLPLSAASSGTLYGNFPIDFLFGLRNLGFLLGIVAGWIVGRGSSPPCPRLIAAVAVTGFFTTGALETFTGLNRGIVALYLLIAFVIVLASAAAEQLRAVAVPRPLVALGEASYSLYLVHYPICVLVSKVARKPVPQFVTMVVVSLAAAIVVRYVFEAPVLKALRGRKASAHHHG
jgi:exopolysaccharide production protein ExoZ